MAETGCCPHWSDSVGAGRSYADAEEVEDADGHDGLSVKRGGVAGVEDDRKPCCGRRCALVERRGCVPLVGDPDFIAFGFAGHLARVGSVSGAPEYRVMPVTASTTPARMNFPLLRTWTASPITGNQSNCRWYFINLPSGSWMDFPCRCCRGGDKCRRPSRAWLDRRLAGLDDQPWGPDAGRPQMSCPDCLRCWTWLVSSFPGQDVMPWWRFLQSAQRGRWWPRAAGPPEVRAGASKG